MYKYKECMVAQTQKLIKMEYFAFIYGENVFIVKGDTDEYYKFEERFGSPRTSGTFEEMIKYSTDYQEYGK